jgi:hypothetical protein
MIVVLQRPEPTLLYTQRTEGGKVLQLQLMQDGGGSDFRDQLLLVELSLPKAAAPMPA